ncbi:hypothetical protein MHU86_20461 [Fragilaria crotonensis]|nr:hypothetical protein MHU86_20461 [Fragilaria crotonensis]
MKWRTCRQDNQFSTRAEHAKTEPETSTEQSSEWRPTSKLDASVAKRFLSLRRENVEIRNDIAGILQAMERFHIIKNGNVRRAALQPARRVPRPPGQQQLQQQRQLLQLQLLLQLLVLTIRVPRLERACSACPRDDESATLMPNPRSLYDLWNEYLHRSGKACKAFLQN